MSVPDRPHVRLQPAAVLTLGVVAWLALGCLLGFHWLVLFLCVAKTAGERRACLLHFASYALAAAMLLAGGGWCRASGRYVHCAGNETMSRRCMMEEQHSDYRVVYVQHFVGLSYLCIAALADLLQLPAWCCRAGAGGGGKETPATPLTVLYSPYALTSGLYPLALALATTVVTLIWALWYEWSTADGSLEAMAAGACLPAGLGVLALAGVGMNVYARRPGAQPAC